VSGHPGRLSTPSGVVAAALVGVASGMLVIPALWPAVRSAPPLLGWIAGCWALRTLAVAVRDAAALRGAHARNHQARRVLLHAVRALGSGAVSDDRVRELAYRAAGVAIRWEPKPGQAVAPLLMALSAITTVVTVTAALLPVAPGPAASYAAVALIGCLGAAIVGRPGATWRGRTLRIRLQELTHLATSVTVVALASGDSVRHSSTAPFLLLAGFLVAGAVIELATVDPAGVRRATGALRPVRELSALGGARSITHSADSSSAPVGAAAIAYHLGGLDGRRVAVGGHLTVAEPGPTDGPYLRVQADGAIVPAAPNEVLVLPTALQRLVFATLADNVTLGTTATTPPDPASVRWDAVASDEFTNGIRLTDRQWWDVLAARLALRLARQPVGLLVLLGTPDEAVSRVLARWRSTGGTVIELPAGSGR
jgi:hypothetical protein